MEEHLKVLSVKKLKLQRYSSIYSLGEQQYCRALLGTKNSQGLGGWSSIMKTPWSLK